MFAGNADEAEICIVLPSAIEGVNARQFPLAVGASRIEEHHYGFMSQQGIGCDALSVMGDNIKLRNLLPDMYHIIFFCLFLFIVDAGEE